MSRLVSLTICAALVIFGPLATLDVLEQRAAQIQKEEEAARVLVCLDAAGEVTTGEDWKECRMVRFERF